jgi:hypothetical protein
MRDTVSRNIPLPIKRKVRQRCGFGCVICGLPLYEYEHLLGFAKVKRHVDQEITLLCDQHHREKTSGLLPVDVVIEANKSPYNHRKGTSKPYDLHFFGESSEVILGNNMFSSKNQKRITNMVPVSIDNLPLIRFTLEDEHLLLTANIFDEFNKQILQIHENQLIYSTSPWDIEFVGRNLTIREAQSNILIDFTFEVPNRIHINKGRLLYNGVEILISPDHLMITNNGLAFSGCTWPGCQGGLFIGHHSNARFPVGCHILNVPRYLVNQSSTWEKEAL